MRRRRGRKGRKEFKHRERRPRAVSKPKVVPALQSAEIFPPLVPTTAPVVGSIDTKYSYKEICEIVKGVKDELDSHFVVGHVLFVYLFHAVALCLQYRAGDAYPFDRALCYDRFVLHVEELILEGRAACIDYKNFHVKLYFS